MNNTTNMVDITNLSDAALDVVLSVKAGEENVSVDHLSPSERYAVCEALRIKAPAHWIMNSYPEPRRSARSSDTDFEAMILAGQEADESRWT